MTEPMRPASDDVTRVGQPELTRTATVDDATLPPSTRHTQSPPVVESEINARERFYQLENEVARGGMGAILRAKDVSIERTVALKVVLESAATNNEMRQRFTQEAKLTGQLEHPNIVPVHDLSFDEQGRPFYTMKFVKGVTLQEILSKLKAGAVDVVAQYPLAQLLTIFQKVCDAIAFAHSKSVIHRDLKPANIMVGEYGEVLVMDWGLAKVVGGAVVQVPQAVAVGLSDDLPLMPSTGLTLAGAIMGSPQYMAPEQAAGELEKLDARTDIFALGGILYHILTLHAPVSGKTVPEMLAQILAGEILPPSSYNTKTGRTVAGTIKVGTKTFPQPPLIALRHCPGGRIPESLGAVAMKALALQQEGRYQSVPELQRDVTAYQGGFATGAEKASAWRQLVLLMQRHKKEFTLAAMALVVLLGTVTGFLVKVTKERNRAEAERQRAEVNERQAKAERQHAETEKANAQTERDRAEKTLTELHKTAPTFYAQAQTLIEQHQLPEALEKISFAISLAPEVAEYHVLQGNLLQTALRMAEARDAYSAALQLQPKHELARKNRQLCESFLQNEGGKTPYHATSLNLIQTAMLEQGRIAEVGMFMRGVKKTTTDPSELLDTWRNILAKTGFDKQFLQYTDEGLTFRMFKGDFTNETLAVFQGMPLNSLTLGRKAGKIHDLRPLQGMPLHTLVLSDAVITDLSPLQGMQLRHLAIPHCKQVTDLAPLHGMPLESLDINSTAITNLSPLQGMPLTNLTIAATKVSDLSPLVGMRLTRLDFFSTKVSDLSPLRGMPLEYLEADYTPISNLSPLKGMSLKEIRGRLTSVKDLSPLQGMPLSVLNLRETKVTDLTPLAGMPLLDLDLGGTEVSDLTQLHGLPLKNLNLSGCTQLQNLRPLIECRQLEYLILPATCKDIECLRSLPKVKQIGIVLPSTGRGNLPTAAEFWKQYDENKGTGKKLVP